MGELKPWCSKAILPNNEIRSATLDRGNGVGSDRHRGNGQRRNRRAKSRHRFGWERGEGPCVPGGTRLWTFDVAAIESAGPAEPLGESRDRPGLPLSVCLLLRSIRLVSLRIADLVLPSADALLRRQFLFREDCPVAAWKSRSAFSRTFTSVTRRAGSTQWSNSDRCSKAPIQ